MRAPSTIACELGPGDLRVADARADAAVRAGDDVLAADEVGVAHQALGDQLRVLDARPSRGR